MGYSHQRSHVFVDLEESSTFFEAINTVKLIKYFINKMSPSRYMYKI